MTNDYDEADRINPDHMIMDDPSSAPQDYSDAVAFVSRTLGATITAHDAVSNARDAVRSGATDWLRLCLRFVRQCWELPMVEPTAASAWKNAKDKHDWTGDPDDIPYGAPVFSRKRGAPANDAGHVFITGGHWVTGPNKGIRIFRSNDILVQGGISAVAITDIIEKWDHEILG